MAPGDKAENWRWAGTICVTVLFGLATLLYARQANRVASRAQRDAGRATDTAQEALRLAREDYPRVRVAFAEMPDDAGGRFIVKLRAFNDSPGEARNVQVCIGARNLLPEQSVVDTSGSFFSGFHKRTFAVVPLLRHNHPKDLDVAGGIGGPHFRLVEMVWQTDWEYGPKDESRTRSAYGDIVLVHKTQVASVYRVGTEFANLQARVRVKRHSWAVAPGGPGGVALAANASDGRIVSFAAGSADLHAFNGYVSDEGQTPPRRGTVETEVAFLREQPGAASAPVGKVHQGEDVRVRRWVGDWCYVQAPAAGAARGGWIAAWLINWDQPIGPHPSGMQWEGWAVIKEASWADRPEESGLALVP